jgi:UDP-2,3-diacylglucosamine hydrolase
MAKAYFVSDLHLRASKDPLEQAKVAKFLSFLSKLHRDRKQGNKSAASHLFLVGDIFDLWIGAHSFFHEQFASVVQAIEQLAIDGLEIHYFEGNHDLHLLDFWLEKGVDVHTDAADFKINGLKVHVEHGDLINPEDTGYLFLRRFLRTGPLRFLALNLPSFAVRAIGERASRVSRQHTSTAKELPVQTIRNLTRQHAERIHLENKFDLIITGHVHVVDDFELAGLEKPARSVNLGSWFDGARAFQLNEDGSGDFIEL